MPERLATEMLVDLYVDYAMQVLRRFYGVCFYYE